LEILSDRAFNPDYDTVLHLFRKYRETALGSRNGKSIFERLWSMVEEYNKSGRGKHKAALQEFDAYTGKAFILCIVTGLMCRVHEKIPQAHELCYMDASASFELLNTSITLLYDLNRDLDPTARVKSCSMIRVQVESVKRRKIEGSSGRKRKLSNIICEEKEN